MFLAGEGGFQGLGCVAMSSAGVVENDGQFAQDFVCLVGGKIVGGKIILQDNSQDNVAGRRRGKPRLYNRHIATPSYSPSSNSPASSPNSASSASAGRCSPAGCR